MKGAGHIPVLRVNVTERRRRKSLPPVPQFEARVRKLFMLDIAFTTVHPLLFYVTF